MNYEYLEYMHIAAVIIFLIQTPANLQHQLIKSRIVYLILNQTLWILL